MFEFKYIPDLSRKTQMEDGIQSRVKKAGIEERNLQALSIGCILFIFVGFFGLKMVPAISQWLP